jgi:two-component system response regulator HydG
VLEYLQDYPFSGNVRELENMVEQGVALAYNGLIHREDVMPNEGGPAPGATGAPGSAGNARSRSMQSIVDEAETSAILSALREVDGNRERAAEMLGLSPTTLWRKMKRLNIDASRTA